MAWIFDPKIVDLVWQVEIEKVEMAVLDIGSLGGDIALDTGNRTNEEAIIDNGLRVI